jgi:hypothetical protein
MTKYLMWVVKSNSTSFVKVPAYEKAIPKILDGQLAEHVILRVGKQGNRIMTEGVVMLVLNQPQTVA